jgi:hypothetical protein
MHRRIRSIVAAGAATLIMATAATAGLSGAIFTTNDVGQWVNGNVYDHPEDVYLNGGPRANQNCTAAGLPDGNYYFQVTDPSGKELLSGYGHQNGIINVSNGVIADPLPAGHVGGAGPCGRTVQLMPFAPTSNLGSEYKVWLTPVGSYACTDPSSFCGGSFGFFSSNSKTDNFKVQPPDVPDGGD